jgi:pilus assembly protein CpaB
MKLKLLVALGILALISGLYGVIREFANMESVDITNEILPSQITAFKLNETVRRGTIFDASQLTVVNLSKTKANNLGIYEDVEFEGASGSIYKKDFKASHFLLPRDLASPKDDDFIDYLMSDGGVPFRMRVETNAVFGGTLRAGDLVSILTVDSVESEFRHSRKMVSVEPLLSNVKVLNAQSYAEKETNSSIANDYLDLVLELAPDQTAKMVVAQEVSKLKIYKSNGDVTDTNYLHATSSDVLRSVKGVREFRAKDMTIN